MKSKSITRNSFRQSKNKITNSELIENLSDFQRHIDFIQSEWFGETWFRGLPKSKYELRPSIYRTSVWHYNSDEAKYLTDSFIHRAKGYLSYSSQISKWEWYYIMQHYGLPTRLLDWTKGYFIALFFAVRNLQAISTPCVWIINPFDLNLKSQENPVIFFTDSATRELEDNKIVDLYLEEGTKLPKFPLAIEPPYINERMSSQRSCFTVHGALKDGFVNLHRNTKQFQLVQLRIKNEAAEKIKNELTNAGISEATLFSDLEGIARELKYHFDMV